MTDKPLTIIISDLHLGGGIKDRGDDHIYQNSALIRFLQSLETKEKTFYGGKKGIELFINGDFLEFAQVKQTAYKLRSAKYWCSEKESLQKLESIITGHANIFAALKKFHEAGNRITVAAGNHDVDLYWYGVRDRLKKAAGPIDFALEKEWYFRYEKRLAIAHGHMFDPANRFNNWSDPVLVDGKKVPRLEMCPGTLFMVKFVNLLEKGYPFIDNIKPVTALMPLLWKERRGRFWLVAWLLYKFLQQHPVTSLGIDQKSAPKILKHFSRSMLLREDWANAVTQLYQRVYGSKATVDHVRKKLETESDLFDFLYRVIATIPPEQWMSVFDELEPRLRTLSIQDSAPTSSKKKKSRTLSLAWSNIKKEKEVLRREARRQFLKGSEVVVMGHTHQPDEIREMGGVYFNPGSWTRYADLDSVADLRLDQLKNEQAFPYQLNYVRVEKRPQGTLQAEMICFEEEKGSVTIGQNHP